MSITFWMPDAPTQRVQPYPVEEPDYWVDEPVPPFMEINMSNSNAIAVLQLISPKDAHAYSGTWNQADLARVRAAVIKALNTRGKDSLVSPDQGFGADGHARMVVFGRSEEYVTQRLNAFLALTKVAMDHNMEVVFG